MIEISSEPLNIFEFIDQYNYSNVTLDIETLDSGLLRVWSEPIVSFSLSFVSNDSISSGILSDIPTFAFGIKDVAQEKDLLLKLKKILLKIPQNTTLIGHNISYELECKKANNRCNCYGYDIPKILTRSGIFGINLDLIRQFKTYDTMDVAYFKFNHEEHGKLRSNGEPKRFLSSEDLEEIFNIERPEGLPKLGCRVRDFFKEGRYKEILLYNCSDTIIESLFYRLFEHKLKFCKHPSGLISAKKKCIHIPEIIKVEDVEAWKRLTAQKSIKE